MLWDTIRIPIRYPDCVTRGHFAGSLPFNLPGNLSIMVINGFADGVAGGRRPVRKYLNCRERYQIRYRK